MPDRIDDGQDRAVAGVVEIVRLPYGLGVIAQTPSAAFNAKNALNVTWTEPARRRDSTAKRRSMRSPRRPAIFRGRRNSGPSRATRRQVS